MVHCLPCSCRYRQVNNDPKSHKTVISVRSVTTPNRSIVITKTFSIFNQMGHELVEQAQSCSEYDSGWAFCQVFPGGISIFLLHSLSFHSLSSPSFLFHSFLLLFPSIPDQRSTSPHSPNTCASNPILIISLEILCPLPRFHSFFLFSSHFLWNPYLPDQRSTSPHGPNSVRTQPSTLDSLKHVHHLLTNVISICVLLRNHWWVI